MANSQSKIQNPKTQYHTGEYPQQKQPAPGVQSKMEPVPDCGEKSYKGSGRLQDRKAGDRGRFRDWTRCRHRLRA